MRRFAWDNDRKFMANKVMIAVKIDCTKIEKARLFKGKNGAQYLDAILIESTNSQYGDDFMVTQSVSKEEREKGIRGPILGNAKYLGQRNARNAPPAGSPAASQHPDDDPNSPPF